MTHSFVDICLAGDHVLQLSCARLFSRCAFFRRLGLVAKLAPDGGFFIVRRQRFSDTKVNGAMETFRLVDKIIHQQFAGIAPDV